MYALTVWTLLFAGGSDISEAIKKDKTALQGTWQVIESVDNGEKVPANDLKELFLLFRGNAILIREGGKTAEKFSFLLDPTKKPRHIDLTLKDGPKKGQTDQAIYALDGDRLRICIQGNKDAPRPTDFNSNANSNRWLVVLQRTKE